jgi:hypothetical protein
VESNDGADRPSNAKEEDRVNMHTISKLDTPLRALGGSGAREKHLANAARAASNASAGLSQTEFLSDVGPRETEQLIDWSEKLKLNRVWLRRVLDTQLEHTSSELTRTTRAVFEVLARYGPEAINVDCLSAHVNGVHLAMVLRATADELEGTPAWTKALQYARAALESAGIDPHEALYGLIPRE